MFKVKSNIKNDMVIEVPVHKLNSFRDLYYFLSVEGLIDDCYDDCILTIIPCDESKSFDMLWHPYTRTFNVIDDVYCVEDISQFINLLRELDEEIMNDTMMISIHGIGIDTKVDESIEVNMSMKDCFLCDENGMCNDVYMKLKDLIEDHFIKSRGVTLYHIYDESKRMCIKFDENVMCTGLKTINGNIISKPVSAIILTKRFCD